MTPASFAPRRARRRASAAALGFAVVLLAALAATGCRKEPEPVADPAPASPYDVGPRAGEFPFAERLAEKGRDLFKQKGCTACHAFGRPLTGPDLRGVTMRRSAAWIQRQILHPDIMLQEDPITIDLYNQFMVRMANQGLTPYETQCVMEYLKWVDEDSTQAPPIPGTPAAGAPAASPGAPAAPAAP